MKRSAPMRRTGFARKAPPRPPNKPVMKTPKFALTAGPSFRYGTATEMREPIEKHDYVRSNRLMEAYRCIPCQRCGADDGTVCGAHSNWHPHNKSLGVKADDNRCASLCHKCHSMIDQGRELTINEKQRAWWVAHVFTVRELQSRSLWPDGIPIPDISNFPTEWKGRIRVAR